MSAIDLLYSMRDFSSWDVKLKGQGHTSEGTGGGEGEEGGEERGGELHFGGLGWLEELRSDC